VTGETMARVNGGAILVRVFEQHGVDVVFTLHGGHLDAIYQAARGRPLRWIDTRHEQAAGHAADGWARTTGRVGVALVTAGPGVTDVVTAVTNAYLDCIPTLFLGGAAPLRDAETLPLQGGFDQVALMRPITKWAHGKPACVNVLTDPAVISPVTIVMVGGAAQPEAPAATGETIMPYDDNLRDETR